VRSPRFTSTCDGRDRDLLHNLRNKGFLAFNTACFASPRAGAFGNAGRDAINGPGVNNWDVGFEKFFPVWEQTRLEFRAEMFNAFNHTQCGQPNANSGDGVNFGRVSFSSASSCCFDRRFLKRGGRQSGSHLPGRLLNHCDKLRFDHPLIRGHQMKTMHPCGCDDGPVSRIAKRATQSGDLGGNLDINGDGVEWRVGFECCEEFFDGDPKSSVTFSEEHSNLRLMALNARGSPRRMAPRSTRSCSPESLLGSTSQRMSTWVSSRT